MAKKLIKQPGKFSIRSANSCELRDSYETLFDAVEAMGEAGYCETEEEMQTLRGLKETGRDALKKVDEYGGALEIVIEMSKIHENGKWLNEGWENEFRLGIGFPSGKSCYLRSFITGNNYIGHIARTQDDSYRLVTELLFTGGFFSLTNGRQEAEEAVKRIDSGHCTGVNRADEAIIRQVLEDYIPLSSA